VEVLQWHTVLRVRLLEDGDHLRPGIVHVCPPAHFVSVNHDGTVSITPATPRELLHGANRLFTSVAKAYGRSAAVIVLSGGYEDGSEGVSVVRSNGGTVIVQHMDSAFDASMPQAAIATGCTDLVSYPEDMAPVLVSLLRDGHPICAIQTALTTHGGQVSLSERYWLNTLLGIAIRTQGADMGNVQMLEPEKGTLAIIAQRGFGLDFLEHFRTVQPEDESACGRAMRERTTIFIPDVTADPLFREHLDIASSAGFLAVQSTPLFKPDGSLLGVLSTHFRDRKAPLAVEIQKFAAVRVHNLVRRFTHRIPTFSNYPDRPTLSK